MAKKTYTITKENRVANSPFTIEGSNMVIDITHEFPVPAETTCIDASGKQRSIRFIMGCDTIFKDEQIKMGWPLVRNPSAMERAMLTFLGGMNTIPEGYTNLEAYFEAAPWFRSPDGDVEKNKMRPPNSRILYQVHDQDQIDQDNLDLENFITEARQIINTSDKDTLLGLLRLSRPGGVVDQNISIRQLKLQLYEVANVNPDFILKSYKAVKNDKTVIVSKALDYGILSIETPSMLTMQSKTNPGKYQQVARIPDYGGRNAKIERAVAYLSSDEGKTVFAEVKKRCKEFEDKNGLMDDDIKAQAGNTTEGMDTTTTTEATTTATAEAKTK